MSKFYTFCQNVGNNILIRGYENGKQFTHKVPFKPTLYIKSTAQSEWKSLYGNESLEPITFENIREAKDFIERYKDVEGFPVHGFPRWQYQYINEKFPDDIDFHIDDVSTLFFDIEVIDSTGKIKGFPNIQTAEVPIVLISLYNTKDQKTIVLGLKDHKKFEDAEFEYRQFDTEEELLKYFIAYNQAKSPDIWSGWNTEGFDIVYLCNRIVRLFGKDMLKKLSPFDYVSDQIVKIRGEDVQTYEIYGIASLDLLELYKKFGTLSAKESYTLDFIASEELGKTKVDLPGKSFQDNYNNHFDLMVKYSAVDALLVKELNDKKKLIDLALSLSFLYKCTLQDIYKTVMPWEIFIYNHLSKKKIAVPPRSHSKDNPYEGAWVKNPAPGMYGWCMTFDFSSLYPSIIRQWNMSPETFRPAEYQINVQGLLEDKSDDVVNALTSAKYMKCTIAANGTMYDKRKQGFLAELMEIVMEGRKIARKEMMALKTEYEKTKDDSLKSRIAALDSRQNAFKVAANSAYGAIGNHGFHYYNSSMAEAITLTGQLSDIDVANKMSAMMNNILKTKDVDYIVAADTDSVFLDCQPLVDKVAKNLSTDKVVKFLDKFAEQECQKVINQSIDTIFNKMNCFDKVMASKREAIASKTLYRAKKNYAMYVHNSEGVSYDPAELKVMGMEIVRSSTPQWCRKKLKELLRMIFETDELTFRSKFEEEKKAFYNLSPADVAFPRGITDIDKWEDKEKLYKKGTPIHVRASLLYNYHARDVVSDFSPISNGDKLRFCYLKMPNPIKENIIGFPAGQQLPKELNLDKYVDLDLQFKNSFSAPLESLTKLAGWTLEDQSSLESFFA